MPVTISAEIRHLRHDVLAKVEQFATEYLADLTRRRSNRNSFWSYIHFCSPVVIDLIAWERIHVVDLERMPSVKRLFFETARAAHISIHNNGDRKSEFHKGKGKRSHDEISEVELAANILPRLEQILHHWGITYEFLDDEYKQQPVSEESVARLTRLYGQI